MKIIELTCTTDKNGSLRIPRRILSEMGIRPESQVRLAYLDDSGGTTNTYSEFMITPDGLEAALDKHGQDVNGLEVPTELLDAAGISDDSDVTITCGNGEIIIREAGLLDFSAELSELFSDLGVMPDKINITYEGGEADE